jgi:hypothetical protein
MFIQHEALLIDLIQILPRALAEFDSDKKGGEGVPYLEACVEPGNGVVIV